MLKINNNNLDIYNMFANKRLCSFCFFLFGLPEPGLTNSYPLHQRPLSFPGVVTVGLTIKPIIDNGGAVFIPNGENKLTIESGRKS